MSDSEPPEDVSKDQLWDRVRKLEKHVYPDRRDVLKAGVGAAVGGAAVLGSTGSASAATASGQVGTASNPVDVEAAAVNAAEVNHRTSVFAGDDPQTIYDSLSRGDVMVIEEDVSIGSTLNLNTNGIVIEYHGALVPSGDFTAVKQTEQTLYVCGDGFRKPELVDDQNSNQTSSTSHGIHATDTLMTVGALGVNNAGGHGIFIEDDDTNRPMYQQGWLATFNCGGDGVRFEHTGTGQQSVNVGEWFIVSHNNGSNGMYIVDGIGHSIVGAFESNGARGFRVDSPAKKINAKIYCESNTTTPATYVNGADNVVIRPWGPQSNADITSTANGSMLMQGSDIQKGAMRFYDGYTLRKLKEDLTLRGPNTGEIAFHDGSGTPSESLCFDQAGVWFNVADGNTF